MKISRMIFVLVLFLSVLLTGCGNGSNNAESVIASEKVLPSNFYETAYERETVSLFPYLVNKADSQAEFEQTWDLYGFEREMPDLNFDKKSALFIGVIESGSCPYKMEDTEWSSDNKAVTLPLSEPESDCTTDAIPRTFVIEMDKEKSSELEKVVIVQSGIETTIPLED